MSQAMTKFIIMSPTMSYVQLLWCDNMTIP